VVCEVIGASTACVTIIDARKARDRYDYKYPFTPGGSDQPAAIYHIDEYLAFIMREKNLPVPDGLTNFEDLDQLEEIL
jgi:hypothetical protein